MKPILTYRLVPFEGAAVFQIIDMDEPQRGPGHTWSRLEAGISVCSEERPELNYSTVFLRGSSRTDDFATSRLDFESNTARDDYITRVHAALRAWADAGGFPGALCKDESVVVDTYTRTLYAGAAK